MSEKILIGYVILDAKTRGRHKIHGRVYESWDRAAAVLCGNSAIYKAYPEKRNGYLVYPAFVNEEH